MLTLELRFLTLNSSALMCIRKSTTCPANREAPKSDTFFSLNWGGTNAKVLTETSFWRRLSKPDAILIATSDWQPEYMKNHRGIPHARFPSFRHLLLAGGPAFTEDLWYIVCQGLKDAIQTTLLNVKQMVACFQPGSFNVSGDEGMSVRVVARRDSTASDLIRLQQVAEQVSGSTHGAPWATFGAWYPGPCSSKSD